MNIQRVEIDTQFKGYLKRVYAVQGDSGRWLSCYLTDIELQGGYTAILYATKPSGAKIYNSCLIDEFVSVELTEQILAEAGTVACQIEIKDMYGARVSAFVFNIEVMENIADYEELVSSNEYEVLDTALKNVDEVIAALDTNLDDAKAKLLAMLTASKEEMVELAEAYKEIYDQAIVEFAPLTEKDIQEVFDYEEWLEEIQKELENSDEEISVYLQIIYEALKEKLESMAAVFEEIYSAATVEFQPIEELEIMEMFAELEIEEGNE